LYGITSPVCENMLLFFGKYSVNVGFVDNLSLTKDIKLRDALEELLVTELKYVNHRFLVYG